jgi:YjbE family integral membrane protein
MEGGFLGFATAQWALLGEVILINFILSGDNAVVVGMAAAGLPEQQRNKAMWIGIVAATVLRVVFSVAAVSLLEIPGLLFAGGLLLFWVAWNLWREIRHAGADDEGDGEGGGHGAAQTKTFSAAIWQILVADVSMSLDNVLAVAGAAHAEPKILMIGLIVSILLMGIAATAIAKLLDRYRWIAYVGLALIVYVAVEMCFEGGHDVLEFVGLA